MQGRGVEARIVLGAAMPHVDPVLAKNTLMAQRWYAAIKAGGAVRLMRTSLRYPSPTFQSGSEKAAPLGESGGAGLLVGVAILEVALRRKVVVDRGMDRSELL